MKTTLIRLAAGAAMSVVLAIGHPASADEPLEADSSLTLRGVALPQGAELVRPWERWAASPADPTQRHAVELLGFLAAVADDVALEGKRTMVDGLLESRDGNDC